MISTIRRAALGIAAAATLTLTSTTTAHASSSFYNNINGVESFDFVTDNTETWTLFDEIDENAQNPFFIMNAGFGMCAQGPAALGREHGFTINALQCGERLHECAADLKGRWQSGDLVAVRWYPDPVTRAAGSYECLNEHELTPEELAEAIRKAMEGGAGG